MVSVRNGASLPDFGCYCRKPRFVQHGRGSPRRCVPPLFLLHFNLTRFSESKADQDVYEQVIGTSSSLCSLGNEVTPALLRNRGLRRTCLPTFLLSRELQNAFHCGALVAELIADSLYPLQGSKTSGLLRWAAVMFGCWESRPLPRKSFTAWVHSLEATVERLREETREYQNDGVLSIQNAPVAIGGSADRIKNP